jgi:hypothetical protein
MKIYKPSVFFWNLIAVFVLIIPVFINVELFVTIQCLFSLIAIFILLDNSVEHINHMWIIFTIFILFIAGIYLLWSGLAFLINKFNNWLNSIFKSK